jgi:formylglycine-generating enzyme required for sulfatase activity
MLGNVREWCWDYSSNYTSEEKFNPSNDKITDSRILRGGSVIFPSEHTRSSMRYLINPSLTYKDIGFRIVRNIDN